MKKLKPEYIIGIIAALVFIDYNFTNLFLNRAIDQVKKASSNNNVKAFLQMIRYAEGTTGEIGYRTMFTGTTFTDMSRHPNIKNCYGSLCSTAAGAYQFLKSTWDSLQKRLNLPDFSPNSQDLAAIELLREKKALNDIKNGYLSTAIQKVNVIWASLPGSPYGQPTKTLAELKGVYSTNGGLYV